MTTQARSEIQRPKFVSFSGMDGAGKSTQIEALRRQLSEAGKNVQLIPFWDKVATFTSIRETSSHTLFGSEKGVGSPEAPVNRRDKNVQSWFMTSVRYLIYLSDAISLRVVVNKALRSNADLIIFDRYAYDELANLSFRNPANRLYARLIMSIVPQPDISYLLDADPVAARARKPEYPLEFLYICRESYLTLSQVVGGMSLMPALAVHEVQREVLKLAHEKLHLEGMGTEITNAGSRESLEELTIGGSATPAS